MALVDLIAPGSLHTSLVAAVGAQLDSLMTILFCHLLWSVLDIAITCLFLLHADYHEEKSASLDVQH